MRPIDHFFSRLAHIAGSQQAPGLTLERLRGEKPEHLPRLGTMAAFFLGEYNDTMDLDEEDWHEIQETLQDASAEMRIDTLTTLMGELLAVGKLT